jgi:hypothetical protein
VWCGIRAKVCANYPHQLHCLNLPTFWISSFMFKGLYSYVQQLLVMIGVVPFTFFFFCLFGFVCCRLCMTSWFLCFWWRAWCWNLEGHPPLQCWNWHYLIGLMCVTWGMWGGDSILRSTWHWEEAKFLCIWFFTKVLGFFNFSQQSK